MRIIRQFTGPAAAQRRRNPNEKIRIHAENHLLFGMHDATGYGVGWNSDLDRSDVNSVCGDYPAVYSWDLTRITSANHEADTRYPMMTAYARGGINTMCRPQRLRTLLCPIQDKSADRYSENHAH